MMAPAAAAAITSRKRKPPLRGEHAGGDQGGLPGQRNPGRLTADEPGEHEVGKPARGQRDEEDGAHPARLDRVATIGSMPWFICPNCKHRSVDIDAVEGFSGQAVVCRRCGFGFLFELMDDYYPAPSTGFVVCDAEGRILALGRGVFELTGFREQDVLGKDVMDAFGLSGFDDGKNPSELAREWGVRRLGEQQLPRA